MQSFLRRSQLEAIAYFLLLIVCAMAARIWFDDVRIVGRARIDLPILLLAFLSIQRGHGFGIGAGLLLGLIIDATNPGWMGAAAAAYAIVGFFAGSFGQTLYVEKSTARGILVFGAVLLFDAFFGLLSVGLATPFWMHALGSLGSAILTGATATLLTRIYRQWWLRPAVPAEAGGDE